VRARRVTPLVTIFLVGTTLLLPGSPVQGSRGNISRLDEESSVATFEAAANAAGALGFFTDTVTDELVVVVPASLRRTYVLPTVPAAGLKVRFETRDIEPDTMSRAFSRLGEVWSDSSLRGASYTFGFDPRSGKIRVNGTVDAATMLALLPADVAPFVLYKQGEVSRLSRHNDASPYWGGAEVGRAGVAGFDCTTGFVVKNASGTRFMVTAGHCFSLGAVLETGTGGAIGKITSRAAFPTRDMELIGTKAYGTRIYTGDATGVGSIVKGASDPVAGRTIYCTSGAVTFDRCNLTVTDLDHNYCDADGCTPHLAQYNTCPNLPGDSGAPFYLDFALGGYPYIRGMVIAKDPDGCYAHKWSTISSQFGVSIVTG
jgi:hypothetical protein